MKAYRLCREDLVEVKELAIPTDFIKIDYLRSINKIIKDIDCEDMIEDTDLTEFTQEIYIQDKNIEITI